MMTFKNPFEKGRKPMPEGTVREYGGIKFKKFGGKWVYAAQGEKPVAEETPAPTLTHAQDWEAATAMCVYVTSKAAGREVAAKEAYERVKQAVGGSEEQVRAYMMQYGDPEANGSFKAVLQKWYERAENVRAKAMAPAMATQSETKKSQEKPMLVLGKGRKPLPEGTIRTYGGTKFKKVAGKWVYAGEVGKKGVEGEKEEKKPAPVGESKAEEKKDPPKARVSVRSSTHRDKDGFSIVGTDSEGRSVSIFTESRDKADRIVAAIKEGGDHFAKVDKILMDKEETPKKEPPKPKTPRDPATMTPSEVNKELDKLEAEDSKLGDEVIAAGYGSVPWNDLIKIDHPAIKKQIAISERKGQLRDEIRQRMGPGHPSRMSSGFKRRKYPDPIIQTPAGPIRRSELDRQSKELGEKINRERKLPSSQLYADEENARLRVPRLKSQDDSGVQLYKVKVLRPSEMVEKARYIKREGAPGNYKYTYDEPKKKERPSDLKYYTVMGAIAQAKGLSKKQKTELVKELEASNGREEEIRMNICKRVQGKLKDLLSASTATKKE